MHEIAVIEPQTAGPFTPLYRAWSLRLKEYPWRITSILSCGLTILLYGLFGSAIFRLAALLHTAF